MSEEVKKEELKEGVNEEPESEGENELDEDEELLKEDDSKQDEGGAEYRRKSFHARPYESATIEETQREVEEQIVKSDRPKIQIRFSKQRKEFEKDCPFQDKEGGEGDFPEKPKEQNEMIKLLCDTQIQSCNQMKSFSCQTYFNRKVHKSVMVDRSYFLGTKFGKSEKIEKTEKGEGPSQIALENLEEQRRKGIINETKSLQEFLDRVSSLVEEALQSNEIINVFQDDFEMLGTDESGASSALVTGLEKQVDINPLEPNKKISCIRFDPSDEDVVAMSYMESLTLKERLKSRENSFESSIVFWNFKNKQNPIAEVKLWSPVDITTFEINPGNSNLIIAGTYNGQILTYNKAGDAQRMTTSSKIKIRTLKYKEISPPDQSHHGPVTDIKFLPASVGYKRSGEPVTDFVFVMTIGHDGQVLIWDTKQESKSRDLVQEIPLIPDRFKSINVTTPEGEELGLLNIVLDLDPKSKCFWTNTDEGDLVKIEWGANLMSDNKCEYVKTHYINEKTYRPPKRLERSNFFPEQLLAIYDYHFCVWSQNIDKPLYHSSYSGENMITCGAFSPTRPGVILIGRSDGKLELWDFLEQSNKSSFVLDLQVQTFISTLEFQVFKDKKARSQQLVAVGDGQGVARIFNVPKNFRVMSPGEEESMRHFWKRQENRIAFMRMRNEARKKQKQQEEIWNEEKKLEQEREPIDIKADEIEKENMEREEKKYQLFLVNVKQEELHMLSKEEAEKTKKDIKHRFKHKHD